MSKTTIKDIAKKLGIAPSTVSRGLHDNPTISQETKDKILETAQELNYFSNSIAQNLQKGTSDIIGVVVPKVEHKFFAEVMSGITDIAEEANYNVMVCQSNNKYHNEAQNVKTLIKHQMAGLLISVSSETDQKDHLDLVTSQDIPLVFFDRAYEDVEASRVIVDDYGGAYNAVDSLIKKGYDRIAYIAANQNLSIARKRYKGYVDALIDNKIEYNEDLVIFGGVDEKDGKEGFNSLVSQLDSYPDAIFAFNDPVAIGVYLEMRKRDLKIPDDIALSGFCNNPNSRLLEPPLTTVNQPAYEIGKEATKLLLKQIKNDDLVVKEKILDTELIEREST